MLSSFALLLKMRVIFLSQIFALIRTRSTNVKNIKALNAAEDYVFIIKVSMKNIIK